MSAESRKSMAPKNGRENTHYFQLESAREKHEFSDFVQMHAYANGIQLSFGRWSPEDEKFAIFRKILLPFDTAESLSNMIQKTMSTLEKQGVIKKFKIEDVEKS